MALDLGAAGVAGSMTGRLARQRAQMTRRRIRLGVIQRADLAPAAHRQDVHAAVVEALDLCDLGVQPTVGSASGPLAQCLCNQDAERFVVLT